MCLLQEELEQENHIYLKLLFFQVMQKVLQREVDDPLAQKTLLMAFTGTAAYTSEGCTLHYALHLKIGTKNDYLSDAKRIH